MQADNDYQDRERFLARQIANKLRASAHDLTADVSPHAVATAFISVGLEVAGRHRPADGLAEWLGGIADELLTAHDERVERPN